MKTKDNHEQKENILNSIKPEEAVYVLNCLMKDDSGIRDKVCQIMLKSLKQVNVEDIATDVYSALDFLDVEDLWDRSGKTRYGYVEPTEEAWVMVEEVIVPFSEEIKKYQRLGMHMQARDYCIGIIKGLQYYENESNSEFKDWAVDAPSHYIDTILEEYKKGNPHEKDISDVEMISRRQ